LDTIIKAQTTQNSFVKNWLDFEKVHKGEIVAIDGKFNISAPYD
jgi:hypothetical protein